MPFDYQVRGTAFTETRIFEVAREAVLLNIFSNGDWDNLAGTRLLASDIGTNGTRDGAEIRIDTAPNDTVLSGGFYYHAQCFVRVSSQVPLQSVLLRPDGMWASTMPGKVAE